MADKYYSNKVIIRTSNKPAEPGRLYSNKVNISTGKSPPQPDKYYSNKVNISTGEDPFNNAETYEATNIGPFGSTLNGLVEEFNEDNYDYVNAYFMYRQETGSSWNTTETLVVEDDNTPYDFRLSDLDTDTQYEFRAVISDENNESVVSQGSVKSFTTLEDSEETESLVYTLGFDNLGLYTSNLHGVVSNFDESTHETVWGAFYYREASNTEWTRTDTTDIDNLETEYSHTVENLSVDTQYEFRAVVLDDTDEELSTGDILTFTTLDTSVNSIVTGSATDITTFDATIHADLESISENQTGVEATLRYRERGSSDWITATGGSFTEPTSLQSNLTELEQSTQYQYQAIINDFSGNRLDSGDIRTFTTSSPADLTLTFDATFKIDTDSVPDSDFIDLTSTLINNLETGTSTDTTKGVITDDSSIIFEDDLTPSVSNNRINTEFAIFAEDTTANDNLETFEVVTGSDETIWGADLIDSYGGRRYIIIATFVST